MLSMAKATPNFSAFSSPCENPKDNNSSIRQINGSVFFNPFSRTPILSSKCHESSTATARKAYQLLSQNRLQTQDTGKSAQICKFCELGDLQNAMDLLCTSEKFELGLNAYCSVLQLCADCRSLQDGRKVRSVIGRNGVRIDGLLGAKLVFMYVKCGDLIEGRLLFDKIANEKVFLWNLLINEYAKIYDFEESIFLFRRMQSLGIEMNSHAFSSVLKCFAAMGCVVEGEAVHGHLLKLGFGSYCAVGNSLISFYLKGRRVKSACKVFDEMSARDVISWNSMISGFVSNGLARKGLDLLTEMMHLGVEMDVATMVIVLAACADVGTIALGKELHAYAIKARFAVDESNSVNNTLLDMYSKCGDINAAIKVFERIDERSVVSWTSMLAGYAREGLCDKAMALFHEMVSEGLKPDKFTVTSVLHACACNGSLENGKLVHDYIRDNNIELCLLVSNALMDMYAKCGSTEEAFSVFSDMPEKDIVSWNTIIGGYSKNNFPNEALTQFVEMQKKSKPDSITMAYCLRACASLSALERGREIHGHILRIGFSSDKYVANALIDMYVKCGALVLAQLLFDMIPSKDLVSWTVMIAGYGMHGFGDKAISAFDEMRIAGIEPDEVSFVSMLYACSHSGLANEGWKFFNIMKNECNISPMLKHYACMVDLLARAGDLMDAYKFIQSMPLQPDATIWGALLCGCRIHHNVKLAEKVAEHVFELEPENTGYYVLLANIYAEAEKWEEVRKLREKIGRRGLKKNPGCSWIEIRGKVHIFVARDGSHPQSKNIELLLKQLRAEMKEEGYVPDKKFALINADEMEKEVALCGHSEKLAMALGILSLPRGKTIRVTKNLRVCGDCHEMAKFISKVAGREIVLRDSNRFHHFKNGHCSCRGYW